MRQHILSKTRLWVKASAIFAIACLSLLQPLAAQPADTLYPHLASIPGISELKQMESNHFNQKYSFFIDQPLDHANPAAGTFRQRVFVMNVSFDRPTVIVTEGYGAGYVLNPAYREEISRILNTNVVFVEHRYFLESTPKDAGWKYLTAKNSAYDLNNVRRALSDIYNGKWIATGISKGGQTALIYASYFPEDIDITVPYVAPLCRAKEDGRHEPFLREKTGTAEERRVLEDFQREVLSRRAELQPKFDSLCKVKGYEFNLPLDEIYDYSVLEFPFAFWQWGSPVKDVPSAGTKADSLFNYWMKISSPDYFVSSSIYTAFFVQAGRELGYYGYDTKPFGGLLKIKSAKGYLDKLFVPEEARYRFDKRLYRRLKRFVAKTDERVMFIYGEYDPWSAVMPNEPKRANVVFYIQPKGSHRARISSLPGEMREDAVNKLKEWVND